MTGIHLRAKVFPLAFLLYLFKPKIAINGGAPAAGRWGDNPIPLAPGRHEVSCWFNYLFGPANRASIVVDVPPGQMVPVTYRTRWLVFLPGKIAVEGALPAAAPAVGAPPVFNPSAPSRPMPPTYAPAAQAGGVPAGWHPDPARRHELRYWNGHTWTEHVSTRGVAAVDPPT